MHRLYFNSRAFLIAVVILGLPLLGACGRYDYETTAPQATTNVPQATVASTAIPATSPLAMAGPTGTLKESVPYNTSNRLTESTVWLYVGTASHETLLKLTPEGTVAGKLAEEWSVYESDTVWSFKLKEGAPFHNVWGEATVDDYIYSANNHVAEGGISWLLETVKRIFFAKGGSMTKIDDYRFEVDTVTPQFDILSFGTSVPTTNLTVSKSSGKNK